MHVSKLAGPPVCLSISLGDTSTNTHGQQCLRLLHSSVDTSYQMCARDLLGQLTTTDIDGLCLEFPVVFYIIITNSLCYTFHITKCITWWWLVFLFCERLNWDSIFYYVCVYLVRTEPVDWNVIGIEPIMCLGLCLALCLLTLVICDHI